MEMIPPYPSPEHKYLSSSTLAAPALCPSGDYPEGGTVCHLRSPTQVYTNVFVIDDALHRHQRIVAPV